jgi:2-hydroxychromene-2-carboxylate isomerase
LDIAAMTTSENGHLRPSGAWQDDPSVPLVVLDLASVETYFLVQPLSCLAFERDGAVWCPLISAPAPLDRDEREARACADRLELELAWPQRHPEPVSRAMRVAALAAAHGRGADFMLGMSRLAWGSGRDLDDPGEWEFAAAENGLDAGEASAAAQEGSVWDLQLRDVARALKRLGVVKAPALRWQGQIYSGRQSIAPLLAQSHSSILESPRD